MIRMVLTLACLAAFGGDAFAQQRAISAAQTEERPGPGATQCRIGEIVYARGGAGFVCVTGSDGRILMATDGGTRPGGIAAFMSWLIEAKNNQTTARDVVTVNYDAADAATQEVCDASGLRAVAVRSPITCYRILAVID